MKIVDSNIACPSCHEALQPRVLACDGCGIRVEGKFQMNEFASLSPDDLHFLRIFVHSEGRIREMESALGLSYPTIRSRLTALKNKLAATPGVPVNPTAESQLPEFSSDAPVDTGVSEVLARLEAGELSYEDAMKEIKRLRK